MTELRTLPATKVLQCARLSGLTAILLALFCRVGLTQPTGGDTSITFNWPAKVQSAYFTVRGLTEKEGVGQEGSREYQTFTTRAPEGRYILQVGQEVMDFRVAGNNIITNGNPAIGVELDHTKTTLNFSSVSVSIDATAFPFFAPKIQGAREPLIPVGTKGEVNLVPSRYQLLYGPGSTEMVVSPDGKIFLAQPNEGFVGDGSTLRLVPKPVEVTPDEELKQWSLNRYGVPDTAGSKTIPLLPGEYEFLLRPPNGPAEKVKLYMSPDFKLATATDGPWQDLVILRAKAGGSLSVSLPGGREKLALNLQARAEGAKALEQYLVESRKAAYQRDFNFTDYMGWYDYPAELLSYKLTFPAGKVKADALQLASIGGGALEYLPFQLTDTVQEGGFLQSATLNFRSGLPRNSTRNFRLTAGLPVQPASGTNQVQVSSAEGVTTFQNGVFAARLPQGEQELKPAKPLNQMPAPLLAISRDPRAKEWIGKGSMTGPDTLAVSKFSAKTLIQGPLLSTQRISYTLSSGASYSVDVSLRAGDDYVTIDETIGKFQPVDGAFFRFGFDNLDPDQRQAMGNGGYSSYSGNYEAGVSEGGVLPIQLGLNTPNSMGLMRSAAFWKEGGQDVLMLAVNHMEDWRTAYRRVWYDSGGPGNLRFVKQGDSKYLLTRLEGKARHWAMGLTALTRQVPGGFLRDKDGAGPEVRLWQKLSDFSLNSYKDWPLEWDEDLTARPDDLKVDPVTFDQWMYGPDGPKAENVFFLGRIPKVYWDYSAEVAPVSFRSVPPLFRTYAASRASWTLDQRKQARTFLIFLAYSAAGDANMPHRSMLSGQPNFLMDVKQVMPVACATFPNFPEAKEWLDSYMTFLQEFFDVYQRKANPATNAVGGRWTENIAGYSGTVLKALEGNAMQLRKFDGTDLLENPHLQTFIKWYRDTMTSPQDGIRRVPPEGAHSWAFEEGTPYRQALFNLSRMMAKANPQLSAEMRWIETNGQEGLKPDLKSVLVNDDGGYLRHDFGGPNEAYLHVMQVSGRWNYRWGKGADMLYYGAKGKLWSYNGPEDSGDEFDMSNLTSFQMAARGLGTHDTDQPLYDFGFAQYLKVLSNPDWGGSKGLKSRSVMMLRDDYIAIYDDVDGDELAGTFTWTNKWEMPQIYQLRPGAKPIDSVLDRKVRGEIENVRINVRKFRGNGDFFTVVAPTEVIAKVKPYGGTVNGEYVFFSDEEKKVDEGGVKFEGTVGYARPNQLAIFEGKSLSLNGFGLARDGGDFGVSAAIEGKTIQGRFTGREGGRITLTPPSSLNIATARVQVKGTAVQASLRGKTLSFPINIEQSEGTRDYVVTFE